MSLFQQTYVLTKNKQIMITTKHRITYARCIDSGMSSALQIATIFKMVYDITDAEALKLTKSCAEYYNETLTK